MAQHLLSLPLTFLLLAVAPQGAGTLHGKPINHNTLKQEKRIEESTAGQQLRQPDEEKAWLEKLVEQPDLAGPVPEEAKAVAKQAVEEAKKQTSLVEAYSENIWAKVRQEFTDRGLNYNEQYMQQLVEKNRETGLYDDTHIYVFVSESMPWITLRNYLKALEGVEATFVLRGLTGTDPSSFGPTQEWVQRLLCGEPPYTTGSKCYLNSVDISPNLFRIFQIEAVPALVYVKNPADIATCGLSPMSDEDYLVWYGDLPPDYVLEKFQKERPQDSKLPLLINKVRQ